jgi:hypothetical protein
MRLPKAGVAAYAVEWLFALIVIVHEQREIT